ncbi:MAG: hypothetical protein J0H42_00090 [Rhizobiales bacterium]|nr:hypothetical protein [Hyphomicrobiales bacterium]
MAQVFEIPDEDPQEKPDSASSYARGGPGRPSQGASNAFQIAAPGPIQRRIGKSNMGPVSDRRKRINAALPRPQPPPNPGPAIRARLIVSGRFDKGTPLPV